MRSRLEEDVHASLIEKGIQGNYERFKIKYIQPIKHRIYTPDFCLQGPLKTIYIETKGRLTMHDRQKHLMIRESNPDLDIRFVFSNPKTKIRKGSKTSYADWCKKKGFQYSKLEIPGNWFIEAGFNIYKEE